MAAFSVFPSFLMLLLAGGGWFDLPLSLPPLPEDPAISRAAPEECLWYLSLAGVAKPDKASKNQTEQLLAEEEVQKFVATVTDRVRTAIAKRASRGGQDAVLAVEGPKLVLALLTHPAAAFVSQAEIGPGGPDIKGGAIVSTGDDTAEINRSISAIEVFLPKPVEANRARVKWHCLPTPGGPVIEWGFDEKYFIIGIGEGSADAISARRKGSASPKWLAAVKKAVPVERTAMLHYVNVKKVIDTATPLVAAQGVDVKVISDTLGLSNVQYVAAVSGLDAAGHVSKALIATDGKPQGVLALGEGKPLTAKDLAAVPADATVATVVRCDLAKAVDQLLEMAAKIEPRAAEHVRGVLAQVEGQLGFSPREDLLAGLGDTWSVYSSPSEGGLLITGLTLVAPIRDRARLVKAEQRLSAMLPPTESAAGDGRRGPTLGTFEFRGQKISFLNSIGEAVPVTPAWCITDKEVIVSLFPQTIKAHLSRPAKGGSLADVAAVAKQLKGSTGPSIVAYQDTATLVKTLYPLVQVGASMAAGELQREGIDINASLLPSAAAVLPHVTPNVTTVTSGDGGMRFESHGTLPLNAGGPAMLLPMLFLARWSEARSAPEAAAIFTPGGADRVQSMNNLKQIGLAMHNFHDANQHFPSATGMKDGKPTLSWRVKILPYIEQSNLYNQFKLDEPWDSENNKRLIPHMPPIYRAPGSKVAGEFKTVYLTPRGADTMFPADRELSFRDITDGTSNTLMVVEATDDKAVIWTKPDDFDTSDDNLAAGLVGLRNGGFLGLMGDGSAHFIQAVVDQKQLKALFTRAGGEVVNLPQEGGQADGEQRIERAVPRVRAVPDRGASERPLREAPPATKEAPAPGPGPGAKGITPAPAPAGK